MGGGGGAEFSFITKNGSVCRGLRPLRPPLLMHFQFLFFLFFQTESSCLFYLSFNFDFCVSKIMHL